MNQQVKTVRKDLKSVHEDLFVWSEQLFLQQHGDSVPDNDPSEIHCAIQNLSKKWRPYSMSFNAQCGHNADTAVPKRDSFKAVDFGQTNYDLHADLLALAYQLQTVSERQLNNYPVTTATLNVDTSVTERPQEMENPLPYQASLFPSLSEDEEIFDPFSTLVDDVLDSAGGSIRNSVGRFSFLGVQPQDEFSVAKQDQHEFSSKTSNNSVAKKLKFDETVDEGSQNAADTPLDQTRLKAPIGGEHEQINITGYEVNVEQQTTCESSVLLTNKSYALVSTSVPNSPLQLDDMQHCTNEEESLTFANTFAAGYLPSEVPDITTQFVDEDKQVKEFWEPTASKLQQQDQAEGPGVPKAGSILLEVANLNAASSFSSLPPPPNELLLENGHQEDAGSLNSKENDYKFEESLVVQNIHEESLHVTTTLEEQLPLPDFEDESGQSSDSAEITSTLETFEEDSLHSVKIKDITTLEIKEKIITTEESDKNLIPPIDIEETFPTLPETEDKLIPEGTEGKNSSSFESDKDSLPPPEFEDELISPPETEEKLIQEETEGKNILNTETKGDSSTPPEIEDKPISAEEIEEILIIQEIEEEPDVIPEAEEKPITKTLENLTASTAVEIPMHLPSTEQSAATVEEPVPFTTTITDVHDRDRHLGGGAVAPILVEEKAAPSFLNNESQQDFLEKSEANMSIHLEKSITPVVNNEKEEVHLIPVEKKSVTFQLAEESPLTTSNDLPSPSHLEKVLPTPTIKKIAVLPAVQINKVTTDNAENTTFSDKAKEKSKDNCKTLKSNISDIEVHPSVIKDKVEVSVSAEQKLEQKVTLEITEASSSKTVMNAADESDSIHLYAAKSKNAFDQKRSLFEKVEVTTTTSTVSHSTKQTRSGLVQSKLFALRQTVEEQRSTRSADIQTELESLRSRHKSPKSPTLKNLNTEEPKPDPDQKVKPPLTSLGENKKTAKPPIHKKPKIDIMTAKPFTVAASNSSESHCRKITYFAPISPPVPPLPAAEILQKEFPGNNNF